MKIVIHSCNLIDVEKGEVLHSSWVVIDDGIITTVSSGQMPKDLISSADVVMDAANNYLIPGLINLHVHIQRRHLHSPEQGVFRQGAAAIENSPDTRRMVFALRNGLDELMHGVTTIRDCSSKGRLNNIYRDCVREGLVVGPDVVSCGLGIASTGGHETHRYQGAIEADGPDAIRKAVREEIKNKADFIKFMGSGGIGGLPEYEHPYWVELSFEELKAGVDEAHNRMKTCTVHAMGKQAVKQAICVGMDGIEHGTNLDDELIDMMKEREVYYVPTMSGISTVADREEAHGNRELAAFIRKLVVYPQQESVSMAYRNGLVIGAGTDTLGDMVGELEQFVACGMTSIDALKTATSNAAKILGKEKSIGSITPGKTADLVLLSENPLQSISNVRNVVWVMKKGKTISRDIFSY